MREDRTISWVQLQQCILSKVRYLMKSEAPIQVSVCVLWEVGWGWGVSGNVEVAQERQEFAVNENVHVVE